MKILLATTCLVALSAVVHAQTATVSTSTLSLDGKSVSSGMQNASNPLYFTNDGKTVLVVASDNSGSIDVEVVTQKTTLSKEGYSTATLSNETVSVPAGATVLIGPFPTSQWNTTGGTVRVNLTSTTEVSATAVKLP